jgi:hypothetical protein
MRFRDSAVKKGGGKADRKPMLLASAAPKRMAATKRSAPAKKPAKKPAASKKAVSAKSAAARKSTAAAKKAAHPKVAAPAKPPAARPVAAVPRLATPLTSTGQPAPMPPRAPVAPARPAPAPAARTAAVAGQSPEERRKAATRKFFARLRSLEAIVGADLRKRGSLVLMQAVDQWYSEAISATATDVTITNAAKAVISQL